ncbi:MAG: type II secretion system F family protein [Elusimicrobia bacterium]|nr:type II secretion system F family protein [Elusimicrobiota bacterium]
MPTFKYRAKTDALDLAEGTLEAKDLDQAAMELKTRRLYPVKITRLVSARVSLSKSELAFFTRGLNQALRAGVPLVQALHLLAAQEKGRRIGMLASHLESQLLQGVGLSDAMSQHPQAFPASAAALVRAGEAGGGLEEALHRIAELAQRDAELAEKVRTALVYPVFVLVVGSLTLLVLLIFAVPKLAQVFQDLDQPLPWLTRLMLSLSEGVARGGFLLLLVGLPGFWLSRRLGWYRRLLLWSGQRVAQLPFVRRLFLQADLARWTQGLGFLVGQGVTLTEALRLSKEMLAQPAHQRGVARCLHDVAEGLPLSQALERARIGDPTLRTLIAVGEAEGDLSRNLLAASSAYDEEVDRTAKVFGTLIEPVLIVAVGLVVAVVVFSMLMPVFEMSTLIR